MERCPVGKKLCPLFSGGSGGALWCDNNARLDSVPGEGFERCPMPNRRRKLLNKISVEHRRLCEERKKK